LTLRRALIGLGAGVGLSFLILPIAALFLRGIERQAWAALSGTGSALGDALLLSVFTTLVSVMLTVIFGTPLAYALARWRFPLRGLVAILVELPVVLPPAVAGLGLLVAFGRRGLFGEALTALEVQLPFTTAAVVLAQTFVSAPFYIRAAQIGFRGVGVDYEDAARVDGATEWRVFRFITLPLSAHALAAGLILSWARALGEFGATILFAGSLQGRTQTLPLLIYTILERDIDAALWAGVLLVGMAAIALVGAGWLARRAEGNE